MGPVPRPAEVRFWTKVQKTVGCWQWLGATAAGYGRFYVAHGSSRALAHRFAYELLIGPIPEGLVLDHLCRNTLCVNPQHLEPVDNRTNVLRGVGPAAVKARQTHCIRGHEYTPENTIASRRTGRACRACKNTGRMERYYKARAAS